MLRLPSGAFQRNVSLSSSPCRVGLSSLVCDDVMSRFAEEYQMDSTVLGQGGFGTVCRAQCRESGCIVAVKVVPKKKPVQAACARHEAEVMKHIDHPSICHMLDVCEDEDYVYLVLEYIDGCELYDEIVSCQKFQESRAADVLGQLLGALKYCHDDARGVVHRDVKPENIMIQRNSQAGNDVKLIDFGLAVVLDGVTTRQQHVAGTAAYLAPEARGGHCTTALDCWSAGVVLHTLLCGTLPVVGSDFVAPSISSSAKDLLSCLMRPNPRERITAAEAANHPWLTTTFSIGAMALQRQCTSSNGACDLFREHTLKRQLDARQQLASSAATTVPTSASSTWSSISSVALVTPEGVVVTGDLEDAELLECFTLALGERDRRSDVETCSAFSPFDDVACVLMA